MAVNRAGPTVIPEVAFQAVVRRGAGAARGRGERSGGSTSGIASGISRAVGGATVGCLSEPAACTGGASPSSVAAGHFRPSSRPTSEQVR